MTKISSEQGRTEVEAMHVSDARVEQAVEEAARAACQVLDELFPGSDAGGIGSNFQGRLESVLTEMLNGRDPASGRSRHTQLPKLALTDEDFGRMEEGYEIFYIVRAEDGWVLDWAGKQFVKPMREQEGVDPFVTFADAVKGAIKWMACTGCQLQDIKVVGVTMNAYRAHGALASGDRAKLSPEFTPATLAVCALLDCWLISDLADTTNGRPQGVYAVGTRGDGPAGIARVVASPWFSCVQDLEVFCEENQARYKAASEADDFPDVWFWEEQVTMGA